MGKGIGQNRQVNFGNCLRPQSQINWVLDGFRSRRFEAIHLERASMAEQISPTEATASTALQWMYTAGAGGHMIASGSQYPPCTECKVKGPKPIPVVHQIGQGPRRT